MFHSVDRPLRKLLPTLLLASAALIGGSAAMAADEGVSRAVAKPLKASQDALQAKNYAEAIAKAKEADAASGKTEYDQYIINSFLMAAYAQTGSYGEAEAAAEKVAANPKTPPAEKLRALKGLTGLYTQTKDYEKALNAAQRAQAAGDNSDELATQIAGLYQKTGQADKLIASLQDVIGRAEKSGRRPTESSLVALWSAVAKSKRPADQELASRTVEKLISYYPKPDYWRNAVAGLLASMPNNDDHLKLQMYRLLLTVGVLYKPDDYREMAQIALDQYNPGEAQSVMEQGFAKNLFPAESKDSNTRLLGLAKTRATEDRSNFAKYEQQAAKAAGGEASVQLGGAYAGFGQFDKAAQLITAGIAKGQLKSLNDAYMTLGYAYAKANKDADAAHAFRQVTGDPNYVRLAKLWLLKVH